VEAENRAAPDRSRRTGDDPRVRPVPGVPPARPAAGALFARPAGERTPGSRVRLTPGQRRLSAGPAPWPVMWAVRHFLAERTAEVSAAADADLRAGAGPTGDPGRTLANCEAVRRVIDSWDAVTRWADDPDAEVPEAYRVASQALFAAMWRLALRHADHPGFDPGWLPAGDARAV